MTILLALLGLALGIATNSLAVALIGAAAGAALGRARAQHNKLAELRVRLDRMKARESKTRATLEEHALLLAELRGDAPAQEEAESPAPPEQHEARASALPPDAPLPVTSEAAPAPSAAARKFATATGSVTPDPETSDEAWPGTPSTTTAVPTIKRLAPLDKFESVLDRGAGHVRGFVTGGNTVVRVGLLVLLVGVVLLLKYAAEHAMFPIELRLASAALIGFALIGVGLRQRVARHGFGMTLQGGGVATLYLVVFFAFRVYDLLPAPLAFGLLAGIACFSGVLAVSQNSMALIVIGIVGGFLAPVLASTSSGNHVALFSYYLLLNLLIVAVAWFKSWRPLNLLGFAFTFGIGSTWGALRYRPEDFASTEPFLVAFFLLYVAIVVIFAWRRPANLRGWVDGSLTFGTPLAVLGLQYAMVKDEPFGMAYTTLGMAAVYVLASLFLFRRAPKVMRNVVEAFLVLGVGFATLAVPYGFSNQTLTGATWAVEGLGLFWIGIRQQRWLSRVAGMILQVLAGGAFLWSLLQGDAESVRPVLNAPFAACTLLALSALGIAYLAQRHSDKLHARMKATVVFIPWALLWWYSAGLRELSEHVGPDLRRASLVGFVAGTGLIFELVGRRLSWRDGRLPGLLSVPALLVLLLQYGPELVDVNPPQLGSFAMAGIEPALALNPLAHGGFVAWPLFMLGMLFTLFRFSRDHGSLGKELHALALWSMALWTALQLGFLVRSLDGIGGSWPVAAFGVGLLLVAAAGFKGRLRIQSEELRELYLKGACGGLIAAIALWQVRTNIMASGASSPLPYWPLLNPLDVSLGLAFLGTAFWLRGARVRAIPVLMPMAFLWFNGILARTVHHFSDVHYELQALWHSVPLQVSVSVSWTLIGVATILWATRKLRRATWFAGSALLAVVVAKLFLVDLAHLGPVTKIGTFLVVGVLLLVVGYFSPVPPNAVEAPEDSSTNNEDPA